MMSAASRSRRVLRPMEGLRRLGGGLLLMGVVSVGSPASAMTLTEAAILALQHDPSVAVARAQYKSDQQASGIERAPLRPEVDLVASGAYAKTRLDGVFGLTNVDAGAIEDEYPEWSAKANVRQALFRLDWGDRGKRADAYDTQAETRLRAAQSDVIAGICELYLNVALAQDQLLQTEAEAKAVSRSFEVTRQRFEADLVPGTDVKEAQSRDDLAQSRLISARRTLQDALDAFAESVGTPVPSLAGISRTAVLSNPDPADPEEWVKVAYESNTDIIAARLAADVARTEVKSRRAEAWPQLDLVASAGRSDSRDYIFGQLADDARIGLELNVPITDGGATRARVRQAEAQLEMREADLERTRLKAAREVRKLYRSVESSYVEVEALGRSLASATAAETATRNGYDAGTRTISDVLDAQSRVAQANRDWNTARYDFLTYLLTLKRANGTLSLNDLRYADTLLEGADASP